jgi:SPP1 gp7 family putative phage head morphogenesis protein
MAIEALVNQATRNQVYLERLKSSEIKKVDIFLREADKAIRARLASDTLTDLTRARLEAVLVEIDREIADFYNTFGKELGRSFDGIAEITAANEVSMLNHIAPEGVSFTAPTSARVLAAIKTDPLGVKGFGQGKLLEPWVADMSKPQRDLLTGAIRQGYFQGQSNAEILKTIRGTKGAQYADGLLNKSKRDLETMVRTGIQHVATSARQRVYDENADIVTGYEWVSTLDNRTSQTCRSLDGVVFKMGKGPLPPQHPNCRSTTVPALDAKYDWLDEGATRSARGPDGKSKAVDANQSYYDWLKKQPAGFQNDALGPTMGKLFRDGGLAADEFARLNLGRSFQPLTIAQMREKDPLAFMKAGL